MSDPTDDAGFDWTSPRWRDQEDSQKAVERDRRLWDRTPPGQSGAIDAGASVPGQEARPDERPRPDEASPASPASAESTESAAAGEPSGEADSSGQSGSPARPSSTGRRGRRTGRGQPHRPGAA